MENRGLIVVEKFDLPAAQMGADAIAMEEYEGIEPEFPRVKIPAGGAVSFEIPNPMDPDSPDAVKTLDGVIVFQHKTNAYFESDDAQTNTPPTCSSPDGITGVGNPGGNCANCPLNEFGSDEGGGKACKNMHALYLLRTGDMLPIVLNLPPTSMKGFRTYANNLRFSGRALSSVITSVSLKKQDNGSNTYSVAVFRAAGDLSQELARKAREYAASIRQQLQAAPVVAQSVPACNPETGEISEDY